MAMDICVSHLSSNDWGCVRDLPTLVLDKLQRDLRGFRPDDLLSGGDTSVAGGFHIVEKTFHGDNTGEDAEREDEMAQEVHDADLW